jgi:hypothetical protein
VNQPFTSYYLPINQIDRVKEWEQAEAMKGGAGAPNAKAHPASRRGGIHSWQPRLALPQVAVATQGAERDGVWGVPVAERNVVFAEGVKNTLTIRTLTL